MPDEQHPVAPRLIAAALLISALAARAWSLGPGHYDEMLALCHVATSAMVVGLIAGWPRVVAGALVFHLAFGVPVWLIDVVVTGTILPSSIAAHVGPVVLGGGWLTRRAWPGPVAVPAWGFIIAAMIAVHPLTDPAHNVNTTHTVYPAMAAVFSSRAAYLIANSLLCFVAMVAVERVLARLWRRARG
ncbi:MAG: hypothetical protein IPL61_03070 [Myxococcales bacterium]|nr:hypothetical protein [Myxococcales bacterium]